MTDVSTSTVRIYNRLGKSVGSGFLIGPRMVLTCAHVVGIAIGLRDLSEAPQQLISLDFPMVNPDFMLEASVVFWNPESDIAGLSLRTIPPIGATLAPIVISEELLGRSIRVLGFPRYFQKGVWASGVLFKKTSNNWLQVEDTVGSLFRSGFSGAPVWDEKLGGVVGVVVDTDRFPDSEAAFVIPSNQLIQIWPELNPSPARESHFIPSKRKIKAFLCHTHEDKPVVRDLYKKLQSDGIEPWMDEENLFVGEDWKLAINRAIRSSDVVIICLSKASVLKTGYVQKEIREAVALSEEKPEGAIFLLPALLDECNVPESLKPFNWANLFMVNGYEKLIVSLRNLQI
jgi:hypothetical protein